jgi:hypothetical protein
MPREHTVPTTLSRNKGRIVGPQAAAQTKALPPIPRACAGATA